MKKFVICFICVCVISNANIFVKAFEQIQAFIVDFKVNVNNQSTKLEDDIVVINNKTYLPLRDISEILGSDVEWNETTKTISINNKQDTCELFPFKSGSLYGYIDKFGKIIIEPQFDYAGSFSEGLACVGKLKEDKMGGSGISQMTYGYINTNGTMLISYTNERERDFHNGLVCTWESDGECYFMNRQGENIFNKKYYDIKDFSDGYAAVLLNNTVRNPHKPSTNEKQQWTFVNTKGDECGEKYDDVTSFVNGISIVKHNGITKAINKSFETVFQSDYILKSYNGNGTYIAQDPSTSKLGVIDDKNNIIIDFKYADIHYSDHMYKVGLSNNAYGIINQYGDMILEPKSNQYILDYKAGMSVINDKNSVIDRQGNVILNADKYVVVSPCDNNLLYVYRQEGNKKYEGYIDKYGNVLIINEVND